MNLAAEQDKEATVREPVSNHLWRKAVTRARRGEVLLLYISSCMWTYRDLHAASSRRQAAYKSLHTDLQLHVYSGTPLQAAWLVLDQAKQAGKEPLGERSW